jgi:hypothetical protein
LNDLHVFHEKAPKGGAQQILEFSCFPSVIMPGLGLRPLWGANPPKKDDW